MIWGEEFLVLGENEDRDFPGGLGGEFKVIEFSLLLWEAKVVLEGLVVHFVY